MVSVFGVEAKSLREVVAPANRCWINLVSPTHNELHEISERYSIDMDMLTAALDPDERARQESYDGVTLMLLRIPIANDDETSDIPYITRPLGILLAEQVLITVCTLDNTVVSDFIDVKVKNFDPDNHLQFILHIFYRTTLKYLRFLKEIDSQTNRIEAELQQSLQNQELIKLLNQEKSLVYFTTSLRSNQIMMERLRRSAFFRMLPEDDQDTLEEVILDNTQAIEMANIYTNILSGLMDAFASVISNNLNNVMKTLTKITVILMLPTLVASIYGMNVNLPFQGTPNAFWVVLSICLLSAVGGMLLFRSRKGF
jgi:magnesium transporter